MLAELLATRVRCGVPPLATISNYMPRAAQSNRTLLHHIAWYSWKVVVTAGFAMLRKHCQYWLNNRMQNNQYHSNQILDRMDKWKICRFSGYFGFRSPLVVDLDFANGFFACWHGTHHALANQFHQWVEPWCVSSPIWCKWTNPVFGILPIPQAMEKELADLEAKQSQAWSSQLVLDIVNLY